MVDEMNTAEMEPVTEPPVASETSGPGARPSRRRAFIAVGAVVLVLAVAAVVLLLFGQLLSPSSDDGIAEGPAPAVAQTSQPTTPAVGATSEPAPEEPAPVPLTDVFTFRDIFEPLVKPVTTGPGNGAPDATGTAGSGETTGTENGSGVSVPEGTLLLQDITVEDGVPTAVFVWGSEAYAVQEGDRIADSPWQVLQIESNSVVMLYGDTQVVLSVGQAVSK